MTTTAENMTALESITTATALDNATRFEMTDIDITWHCPKHHYNNMTYSFDILAGEDVDHIVEDFCSDYDNQEEHRCQECEEIGFLNVSWSYTDFLVEVNLLHESIVLIDLTGLPPAA